MSITSYLECVCIPARACASLPPTAHSARVRGFLTNFGTTTSLFNLSSGVFPLFHCDYFDAPAAMWSSRGHDGLHRPPPARDNAPDLLGGDGRAEPRVHRSRSALHRRASSYPATSRQRHVNSRPSHLFTCLTPYLTISPTLPLLPHLSLLPLLPPPR